MRETYRNLPNFAGHNDVDSLIKDELVLAGIDVKELPEMMREKSEVKTIVIGSLYNDWNFTRAWRYWICKGSGIPVEYAMELHDNFGYEVRVDGHCGCPSPLEWFHGLGVGHYHVDSLRGLKELADTIQRVVVDKKSKL